jgi:uncharacterized membrane protein (UPF0127 family)
VVPDVTFRRILAAAMFAALAVGCAGAPAPADARHAERSRTEPLDIVNSQGKAAHFKVEFVDSEPSRERGLMYRKSLAPDAGMLFDFKTPQKVNFWMKNTLIPLDMLFIDAQGRIISIHRQATPLSLDGIPSGGEVRGVLEIPGGRAQELGLSEGDRVRHRIFPGG